MTATKIDDQFRGLLQSPYVAIANRQAELMMRVACEFGFTPASRSRIKAPHSDAPDFAWIITDKRSGQLITEFMSTLRAVASRSAE